MARFGGFLVRLTNLWSAVMARRWVRVLLTLLVFALLGAAAHRALPNRYVLDVELKADTPAGSSAQIYFSQDGKSFYPQNIVGMVRIFEAGQQSFVGRIYSRKPVKALRLDPVDRVGALEWHSLTMQGPGARLDLQGDALLARSPTLDQLELQSANPQRLSFLSTGVDAKVGLVVPPELVSQSDPNRKALRLEVFSALAGLCLLVLVLDLLKIRLSVLGRTVHGWAARMANWLSDEATIVFSAWAVMVYAVLLVLSVVWVALGLYQSSIGVWDEIYSTRPAERSISVGYPKEIRSDEWDVLTPWMLNQVQTGMKVDNPNMGAPAATILAGVPVDGPLMLAQPKYWGFELLDVEHGFSWYWAFKTFGMIAAVFTLLLALTRGDVVVSLAGAIALFGSSTVQWWFSGFAPEMIIGLSVAVVGSLYLLWGRKSGGMVFGAVSVALVVPNLLMHLYPPHLLPVGYLGVFLLGGLMLRPGALAGVLVRWRPRLVMMVMALVLMGWLVSVWYAATADTVRLVMNTVYPGKRFFLGGDLPLYLDFHGIFESWKIEEWPVPFPPTNQTKASRFWVLFPLVLLIVPVWHWLKPSYRVKVSLLAYCLLVLCWASAPLPAFVRLGLAHLGWSMSDPWDSAFGMGVASALLLAVMVAERARGELTVLRPSSWLLALVAFALVLSYGLSLASLDSEFFDINRILLASVVVSAVVWAVHRGNRWLYLGLMLMAAVPPLHVNPVQNGLRLYLDKDLFSNGRHLGGDGAMWAVYGDLRVAQGFKAEGLRVVNGTNYAPRMQVLDVLDPQKNGQDIWNRYAHVEYVSGKTGAEPSFDLVFPDHYQIALDVCGRHIRAIGVTHVAYTFAPSAAELSCLEPLQPPVSDGAVRYFRLK
ncbi:hypothetical protein [Hydrogenophaga sp. RWCD_12]|uniref:DUF7657 domain-containing protein n=1 Tax=Hydrogenophaga sp. RWCD_12 TaxID=3391190 RepID=UPI00398564C9